MPAYRVDHPDFDKPRAVEAANPRRARNHIAAELRIKRLTSREIFALGQQGIELVDITRPGKG